MRVDADNAFDTILAPDNGAVPVAPKPSDYLDELDGEDMSEDQKLELLETLFTIMKAYVDLGYGLDPVNKLIADFEKSAETPPILVNCKDVQDD